jgi:hypothetical protein
LLKKGHFLEKLKKWSKHQIQLVHPNVFLIREKNTITSYLSLIRNKKIISLSISVNVYTWRSVNKIIGVFLKKKIDD